MTTSTRDGVITFSASKDVTLNSSDDDIAAEELAQLDAAGMVGRDHGCAATTAAVVEVRSLAISCTDDALRT